MLLLFKNEINRSQKTNSSPKEIKPQGLIHVEVKGRFSLMVTINKENRPL